MFADLHLHSAFSDGTDTPLELCNLAINNDVKVIAITDHDSAAGRKALLNEKIPQNLRIIDGVEISIIENKKMIHILGYYIDIYDKRLDDFIETMSVDTTENTRINFEKARNENIFLYDWERVLELNPGMPRIGGTAVVTAMGIDGYEVPGMDLWDMFHKYFWPENDNYISHLTFTKYDAIDLIKTIGGIPVIAHPKSIKNDDIVFDLIKYGLQGIEIYHPIHGEDDIQKYLQVAEDKKLYITGGSDWHGENTGEGRAFASTGLAHGDYDILKFEKS